LAEIQLAQFGREHLEGALALFSAEGWDTYTENPERTYRALTAPGSTALVAVDDAAVAGFVQLQSDGEIQAHLSALVVGEAWRGQGLSRRLLREAFARAGGMRIDVISAAESFYRHLGADERPGFRVRQPNLEG
jgi:GNAT superfamily N-acetyltransferase